MDTVNPRKLPESSGMIFEFTSEDFNKSKNVSEYQGPSLYLNEDIMAGFNVKTDPIPVSPMIKNNTIMTPSELKHISSPTNINEVDPPKVKKRTLSKRN